MKPIDSIIQTINDVPPLSNVTSKVIKLLDNPDTSVNQLVSIIQYDQSITANVMKIANSAYYGKSGTVRSLSESLIVLGNKQLKEIILTGSFSKFFECEQKGYKKARGELWQHAASSAILARLISEHIGKEEHPSLFTAALLHDIGKLVLDSYVERYFEQIIALVLEKHYSFIEAESEMIGMNHAEVGAKIAEKWHFPEEIVQAIKLHHSPENAVENDNITHIVYLANVITALLGIGSGLDSLAVRGKKEILKLYSLTQQDIEKIMVSFYDMYDSIQDLIFGSFQNSKE